MADVFIGTSGFSYSHWKGVFYPQNLPQKDWFEFYCQNFSTVEINSSFYHLSKKTTFEKWRREAGSNFVFSVKGWRWITHIKKLKNCQEEVRKFFEGANGLKAKSLKLKSKNYNLNLKNKDIILWQLPPNLAFDELRLKKFLELLPGNWHYAFELRHQSWGNEKTWEILRQYNAAVVFQDYPEWPIFEEITADFVYLRFHGKTNLYSSCYTKEELKEWAEKIKIWLGQGLDVYAYFNNDAMGWAVENAKTLKILSTKS